MKTRSFLSVAGITLVCVGLLAYGAATAAAKTKKAPAPASADATAAEGRTPAVQDTNSWKVPPALASTAKLLEEAYRTLSLADHNYNGHRRSAMRGVAEAAEHLGMRLSGDGRGREPQDVSDRQLREARGLIEKARAGLAADQKQIRKHLDKAIKHIDKALSIR